MSTPEEKLANYDLDLCIPLVLLLNFSLFQYITMSYFGRRREFHVRLLIFISFLSFASLVPFALSHGDLSKNLNKFSEVCSVLTFLMQIVILTRDVARRLKIRQLIMLMRIAEILVLCSLGVLVANIIDLFAPVIDVALVELLDNIVEHVALVFIVGFRFYFMAMALGVKKVLATQKVEIAVYLLFATFELPFYVLEAFSPLDWHHVQGLWMRVTIAMCLSLTVKTRIASRSSHKKMDTSMFNGPIKSHLDAASRHASEVVDVSKPGKKKLMSAAKAAVAIQPELVKRN